MVSRSALLVWAAITVLAALLFVGAYLGLRSVADSPAARADALNADRAAAAAREYGKYVAPDDVCPGADDLGASIPKQVETGLCLINYARHVHGVAPVLPNNTLMLSAALKAGDIVRCGQFSHSACGTETRQRFADVGYLAPTVDTKFGENLAWGGAEAGSPRGVLLGWLDSRAHRENMLRADWNEQGLALMHVASFRGVEDSRVWVSHFGRRG